MAVFLFWGTCALAQPIYNFQQVNSPGDEQNPIMAPDGQTLYFTLSSHEKNIGGLVDYGDIWYSKLTSSGWGVPVHGGGKINNRNHNTVAGFSPDGSRMYLMGHYNEDGKPINSQGISVSVLENGDWSQPKNIRIPYYKNYRPYEAGCLSQDGNVLVFSAEPNGTIGLEDIYVTFQDGAGKWSEPVSLGKVINTAMDDVTPTLSADNKRLYFASNGRGGEGSFDIFYSDRLDESWTHWTEPTNIGRSINSTGREMFYRAMSVGNLYSSTKNSDAYADIIFDAPMAVSPDSSVAQKIQSITPAPDTTRIKEIVYEKAEELKLVRLWGKVINSKTSAPVVAKIHFSQASKNVLELSSDVSGSYAENLAALEEYTVKVEAPGFIGLLEKLDLKTQVMKDLEMNFKLQPAEVGTTVNLKSVLFQQSTPNLLTDSYDELDMVAEFMTSNPKVEIELAGHTDNRGYHNLNMKLSRERVEAVKKYLVAKGIEAKRITGRGYGGTKPIADNDADETRALNRRVEFTILKN